MLRSVLTSLLLYYCDMIYAIYGDSAFKQSKNFERILIPVSRQGPLTLRAGCCTYT